jgi:hypothetical protein
MVNAEQATAREPLCRPVGSASADPPAARGAGACRSRRAQRSPAGTARARARWRQAPWRGAAGVACKGAPHVGDELTASRYRAGGASLPAPPPAMPGIPFPSPANTLAEMMADRPSISAQVGWRRIPRWVIACSPARILAERCARRGDEPACSRSALPARLHQGDYAALCPGLASAWLLAEMKRMGSKQSERRKQDTENCDAAGGPGQ